MIASILSVLLVIACLVAPFLLMAWILSILSRLLGVDLTTRDPHFIRGKTKAIPLQQRQLPLEDEIIRAQWRYDNIFKGGKR